jgi:hypothetical protein
MAQRSPLKPSKNWKVLPKGTDTKTIVKEVKKQVEKQKANKAPLKPRELRYVKAKAEGKNDRHAVLDAGITTNPASADVIGHRLSRNPNIQEAVAQALADAGITLPKAIQPIADGLEATRDVYDKEGNFIDSSPDHTTRLKASGMALDLMGARKQQEGSVNVNFHLHAGNQRGNYGI